MSEETKPQTDTSPTVVSDADLLNKIKMLEARIEVREKQLNQAIDVAKRANDEKAAADTAEKARLIDSIVRDSHFSKDELKDRSLPQLHDMRLTLDKSIEQTFASVAAQLDEAKKPKLQGVDYWDIASQSWRVK